MKIRFGFTLLGLMLVLVSTEMASAVSEPEAKKKDALDRYNVVWTSPSKDYNGTMPIGNGDIGANVWVEPTGDLIFYLSKTDAWSGGGPDPELLKLGRFRVRLDKPLFQEGAAFRQELDLKTGSITINASVGEMKRSIRFWIDANRPVVHLDIQSSSSWSSHSSAVLVWAVRGWICISMFSTGAVVASVLSSFDFNPLPEITPPKVRLISGSGN